MKISYYGYFTPMGGYGIANLNWVKYLRRLGVTVAVDAKFRPFPGSMEWDMLNEEQREMFDEPFRKYKIGIIETTPEYFHLNECKVKICNTMAEANLIGPEWVKKINGMHHVIVPNDFYKRVFMDSGVDATIEVIPHGVDTELYRYKQRPQRKVFKFGSCGYLNERKGAFEMITAFCSEFDKGEPVELHLHSTDPDLWYYKNTVDPRVHITRDSWNFQEVRQFYYDLDCFVFPSRAEGIGYPPREAMSTGLPTIIMNYSGLEDIAKDDIAYVLKPDGYEAANPMREQPGMWAKIDIPQLMYLMRYVYENQFEARRKGKYASNEMYENYRWIVSAKKLLNYLESVNEMH